MTNGKNLLISVICAAFLLLMTVSLILPFAVSQGDFSNILREYPQDVYYSNGQSAKVYAGEMIEPSLVGLVRIQSIIGVADKEVYWALVIATGIFPLAGVALALLKKPLLPIIFTALSLAAFLLLCRDYAERGFVPGNNYALGIGYYSFLIAAVGALVTLITASFIKRAAKQQTMEKKEG